MISGVTFDAIIIGGCQSFGFVNRVKAKSTLDGEDLHAF
jgi:hypothetical protein